MWLHDINSFTKSFYYTTVVPVITTPPINLTVVSPDIATFNCTATAKPQAVILWTGNGIVLNDAMGKFFISDTREGDCIITIPPSDCVITSTLDINDVVPNDSGEYVCTAINAAGSDTASALLTVHGKYSLHRPVYVIQNYVKLLYGTNV